MSATTRKYTLNIELVGDHLEVTIPEIGVTVATVGTTLTEAVDAGHLAIINHLRQSKRQGRRQEKERQPQVS